MVKIATGLLGVFLLAVGVSSAQAAGTHHHGHNPFQVSAEKKIRPHCEMMGKRHLLPCPHMKQGHHGDRQHCVLSTDCGGTPFQSLPQLMYSPTMPMEASALWIAGSNGSQPLGFPESAFMPMMAPDAEDPPPRLS